MINILPTSWMFKDTVASMRTDQVDTTVETYYRWQCDQFSNSLLLNDHTAALEVVSCKPSSFIGDIGCKWINKGELIAGSFVSNRINKMINHADIDIYFHSLTDAYEFCKLNYLYLPTPLEGSICATIRNRAGHLLNIIWGVEYSDVNSLISRFDIRACSVAFDPTSGVLYGIKGAVEDCDAKRIVLNPIPRQTTINRLVKYIGKGFTIDKYQRLFYAELIRSPRYSMELELSTGYRGN